MIIISDEQGAHNMAVVIGENDICAAVLTVAEVVAEFYKIVLPQNEMPNPFNDCLFVNISCYKWFDIERLKQQTRTDIENIQPNWDSVFRYLEENHLTTSLIITSTGRISCTPKNLDDPCFC